MNRHDPNRRPDAGLPHESEAGKEVRQRANPDSPEAPPPDAEPDPGTAPGDEAPSG
ncbi:hypothetical protein [Arenimonas composti]|uniref:Uncharacterized protein n=1 Tax=Arenimonas composti TR7-09 = DSM 18010 TaxID=1121013 RepID=A0A091BWE3_9GAMM|nr:hypothetical protein [Arenimonas composti]KFN48670.1 hypothetical protein P873_13945 [Arenimonas composti TR7-09 = DSM 18010]